MDINKITNRTIFRIMAIAVMFAASIWLVFILHRQLMWVLISFFFAAALNPLVNIVHKYIPGKSRGPAAALVVFGGFLGTVLALALFLPSLISQTAELLKDFPGLLRDINNANTPIANFLREYSVIETIQNNQDRIVQSFSGLSEPIWGAVRGTLGSLIGLLTILGLTFFLLIEGQDWLKVIRKSRYSKQFTKIEPALADMYGAVNGYVVGNVATSLLAAVSAGVLLLILDVPYAIPLALIVGFFDLIPLVGATIGAAIVLIVCLFQSFTVAAIMLIFFIIYQQIENQLLQPMVYSRTVQISPLIVFVAALFGASLAGVIGALLAIPAAASIKIIISHYFKLKSPSKIS